MSNKNNYTEDYFNTYYAPLKKEKTEVLSGFYELLKKQKNNVGNILDLGCGEGEFLKICAEKGLSCYGADISAYALKKARKQVKGVFKETDLENKPIPYPDNFFDAVTMFDLTEHLENPKKVFSEAKRVLKRGGLLFMTTPNGDYWLKDLLGHFVINDPTHINIKGESYWKKLLKTSGFTDIKIKRCIMFGLPPDLQLRYFFKKIGFPVSFKPVFLPVSGLASALFIFARIEVT